MNITICGALEHAVEPIEAPPQQSLTRLPRAQQERSQRRTQRECIERGEKD